MVYFIINGDRTMIKIGRTTDINERVKNLRYSRKDDCLCCGVFQKLTHKEAISMELRLHHRFKRFNCYGEWFEREPIENFIIINGDRIRFPEKPNSCNFLYDLKNNKIVKCGARK